MSSYGSGEVTQLLRAWQEGDQAAMSPLMEAVYGELRRMADRYIGREQSGHTLQPTALVHEAFTRLIEQDRATWSDRRHFFSIAARIMRRILVDHARSRLAAKRVSGKPRIALDEHQDLAAPERSEELVALDHSLARLEEVDPFKSSIVHLRYFGGFSIEETAELLGCARATVVRQWRMAKAWLYRDISETLGEELAP